MVESADTVQSSPSARRIRPAAHPAPSPRFRHLTSGDVVCRRSAYQPYCSGRSRHGQPVRLRQNTPLIVRRWSAHRPSRPGCVAVAAPAASTPHRKGRVDPAHIRTYRTPRLRSRKHALVLAAAAATGCATAPPAPPAPPAAPAPAVAPPAPAVQAVGLADPAQLRRRHRPCPDHAAGAPPRDSLQRVRRVLLRRDAGRLRLQHVPVRGREHRRGANAHPGHGPGGPDR
jgi:hypothetical protein